VSWSSSRRPGPPDAEVASRPPRPAWVELATALLIVSGFISLFTSLQGLVSLSGNDDPNAPLVVLFVTLGLLTMLTGIALRYAHWWLFGVNFIAVAAFLELTSFTVQGLFSGAIDLLVVVVLLVYRPWFAWKPGGDAEDDREDDREDGRD
jgi:hypothetical protein